jgi:hypothetical protein
LAPQDGRRATAQTKAIAHPTDSHLLLRVIEWLNRLARKQGVAVGQSYRGWPEPPGARSGG